MYSGLCRTLFRSVGQHRIHNGVASLTARYNEADSRPSCCSQLPSRPHLSVFMSTSSVPRQRAEKEDSVGSFEELDKPIKFSASEAAQIKARYTLGGDAFPDAPWYQPYVVCFSVGCFCLYFFYLREENDVDEEMKRPLWERVPGLEKKSLDIVLQYNLANKLDTADVEARLKELEEEEKLRKKREALGPSKAKS